MEIQRVGQNFGMSMVKTKEAERFINRLPYDEAIEIKVIEMDSKHNPVDFYVSTIKKGNKEKIQVKIENKTFVQNFLKNPVETIRQGFNYAEKLNAEQQLVKNMSRPRFN